MSKAVVTLAGGRRNPWMRAPVLVAAGFLLAIAIGTALLATPAAVVAPQPRLTLVQALFMSTSATCVTGLAVVDVAHGLSMFGQVVVLALVQLGGLGIMTLAFLVFMSLGGEASAGGEVLQSTLTELVYRERPRRALGLVLGGTLLVEALGAAVLLPHIPEGDAHFKAVFLSVCAFCNAGFDTLDRGLAPYSGSYVVGPTLMLLWVIGGLGFLVPVAVAARWKSGGRAALDLTVRMILYGSAILIPLGAVLFALTEAGGLLAGRPWDEQVRLCVFQGSTTRTAGFSMVDYGQASRATLFTHIAQMLIGAAPGSTAGGMKITAVWIFAAALWARLLNREQVIVFRRAIPVVAIRHAMIVCVCMVLAHGTVCTLMACIEPSLPLEAVAFESASALGTVGLTTGITPRLSTPSQLLLVLTMFFGRLGPLGFLYALVRVRPGRSSLRYPQSDVCVG